MTQTRPGPPPGAGVLLEAELLVEALGPGVEAAGAAVVTGAGVGAAAGVGAGAGVVVLEEAEVAASAAYQVSMP